MPPISQLTTTRDDLLLSSSESNRTIDSERIVDSDRTPHPPPASPDAPEPMDWEPSDGRQLPSPMDWEPTNDRRPLHPILKKNKKKKRTNGAVHFVRFPFNPVTSACSVPKDEENVAARVFGGSSEAREQMVAKNYEEAQFARKWHGQALHKYTVWYEDQKRK